MMKNAGSGSKLWCSWTKAAVRRDVDSAQPSQYISTFSGPHGFVYLKSKPLYYLDYAEDCMLIIYSTPGFHKLVELYILA